MRRRANQRDGVNTRRQRPASAAAAVPRILPSADSYRISISFNHQVITTGRSGGRQIKRVFISGFQNFATLEHLLGS